MDEITLKTISDSINQINNRIDDTNKSIKQINIENTVSHRDINKKIDDVSLCISNIDKESSITTTNLNNHLDEHKKKDNATSINGVRLTALFGNLIAALIGSFVTLKVSGL